MEERTSCFIMFALDGCLSCQRPAERTDIRWRRPRHACLAYPQFLRMKDKLVLFSRRANFIDASVEFVRREPNLYTRHQDFIYQIMVRMNEQEPAGDSLAIKCLMGQNRDRPGKDNRWLAGINFIGSLPDQTVPPWTLSLWENSKYRRKLLKIFSIVADVVHYSPVKMVVWLKSGSLHQFVQMKLPVKSPHLECQHSQQWKVRQKVSMSASHEVGCGNVWNHSHNGKDSGLTTHMSLSNGVVCPSWWLTIWAVDILKFC